MKYFGVNLINRGKSFSLTREEFAVLDTNPSIGPFDSLEKIYHAYTDDTRSEYSEEWCREYREVCLKKYDLNMEYFSKLDKEAFDEALAAFLDRYKKFEEVNNLEELSGEEGFYIMVLDEYKQVYIGKTDDIKKRIMRHWSRTLPFDRTLLPMYAWERSCFSIDTFRAFDTTRIFAWKRKAVEGVERELIRNFPSEFCTNRIGGDITKALEALVTMKERNLV